MAAFHPFLPLARVAFDPLRTSQTRYLVSFRKLKSMGA